MMECEGKRGNETKFDYQQVLHGLGVSQTVHFSVAVAGFIKSHVLHFHPPPSEGGFSPAAPQLNPPPVPLPAVVVVVVIAEDVGPNPVKLGLNAEPVGLDAPNEKPDEVVVGVDEVKLDAPNRSGPEGGAGIEKVFPRLEPGEDAPGLGASQIVHFSLAEAGFIKAQVPHSHPSVFVVGGLNPAAPQLNPPEPELVELVEVLPGPKTRAVEGGFGIEKDGVAADFSAPGFGESHTVHFSAAEEEFIRSQVPHFQPSVSVVGGFNPAAPQLNPPESELVAAAAAMVELAPNENGTGLVAPGLGVSHTVHFSVAETGFIKSQVPHFHPTSCFGGNFKPAAPQSNPPFAAGPVVVVKEVEGGVDVVGGVAILLGPALLRLDDPAGVEERFQESCMGIS